MRVRDPGRGRPTRTSGDRPSANADSVALRRCHTDTIQAIVGATLTPQFNVMVGGVKSTTARLAFSSANDSVVSVASPDTNITDQRPGVAWVTAKLVGANVNQNQKVPSDSVAIISIPLRNRIQDTASTKPAVYATSDTGFFTQVGNLKVGNTTHTFPDIGDTLPLAGASQRIPKGRVRPTAACNRGHPLVHAKVVRGHGLAGVRHVPPS